MQTVRLIRLDHLTNCTLLARFDNFVGIAQSVGFLKIIFRSPICINFSIGNLQYHNNNNNYGTSEIVIIIAIIIKSYAYLDVDFVLISCKHFLVDCDPLLQSTLGDSSSLERSFHSHRSTSGSPAPLLMVTHYRLFWEC